MLDLFKRTPEKAASTLAKLEERAAEQRAAVAEARGHFAEASLAATEDASGEKALKAARATLDSAEAALASTEAALALAKARHEAALADAEADAQAARRKAAEAAAAARLAAAERVEEAVESLSSAFFDLTRESGDMRARVSGRVDPGAAFFFPGDLERAVALHLARAGLRSFAPLAVALGAAEKSLAQRIGEANEYALGQK
jgi:hypothetical protein